MSTATAIFRCKECRKQFKGSEARAAKEICRDCETPLDLPEPPTAKLSPVPPEPDEEFVPLYGKFQREMKGLISVAEWLLFMAMLPVVGIGVGYVERSLAVVIASVSILIAMVSLSVSAWIAGKLILIVIDMANNLQRIADRE